MVYTTIVLYNAATGVKMRKIRLAFLSVVLILTALYGCGNSRDSEKFITDEDLSQLGIRGVNKFGDWYHFQREHVMARVKINKAGFQGVWGNTLYFSEINIVYPTDWKIRVIRVEDEFYLVVADTKRGEEEVSFFVNLIGTHLNLNDGSKWWVARDRKTEKITVSFWPKNLYDQVYKNDSGGK